MNVSARRVGGGLPDGTVRFANDVYDFDLTLERAVAAAKCGRVV